MDKKVIKAVLITILIITILIGSILGGLYYRTQIYSQGVEAGVIQMYGAIIEAVGDCQGSFPIPYGNNSVNLIIYECLPQG